MLNFTRRIKTPLGHLSFYFNEIYTIHGVQFHISVVGPDRKVLAFSMREMQGKWQLQNSQTCPGWIVDLEEELGKSITEELISGE